VASKIQEKGIKHFSGGEVMKECLDAVTGFSFFITKYV
jgi:hypothetical protein